MIRTGCGIHQGFMSWLGLGDSNNHLLNEDQNMCYLKRTLTADADRRREVGFRLESGFASLHER